MGKQICSPNTPLPSPLPIHKNSHSISKPQPKPKIRIIHIFAPEIIKTDAANFRELVQRLTGKPTADDLGGRRRMKKKEGRIFSSNISMRVGVGFGFREKIKGEEEIWSSANSGGGFLGGFADQFDGFMHEINGNFPFMESTTTFMEGTTPVDVYGGGGQLV